MKWYPKALILVLLTALIGIPRLVTGFINLSLAKNSSNNPQASRYYEAAANLLFCRSDLYEQSALRAMDDPQRAIHLFNLARNNGILTSNGQMALGDAYLQVGQVDQAIKEWETLLTEHQEIKDISPRLTEIYHTRQEYGKETALLKTWLEADPSNPDANERLGILLAVSAAPSALPYLMSASNHSETAAARLENLVSALSSNGETPAYNLAKCGQALANLGEWPLAEQAFSQAAKDDPLYAITWAWLGLARQHNNNPGALQALNIALNLDQNSAAIHAMLGTYWLQLDKPDLAIQHFRASTQLEPDNPAWWVARANAAARVDLSEALTGYTQAVNLAPKEAIYWYDLAAFCVENNAYIEDYGLNAALRAFALEPDNLLYVDMLGRAQMATGQTSGAEVMFKKALEKSPNPGQAYIYHFHLGLLYLQTNQTELAKFEFLQTIASNPQGIYGSQAKKLIERYFP